MLCLSARCIYLLILCFLTTLTSQAQERNKYLEPVGGHFSSYAYQNEYYSKVREVLYVGLADDALAQVVVRPSFQPEYALSIERQDQRYYLLYNVAQRSIWGALQTKQGPPVTVESRRVEIGEPLAMAVVALWNTAIGQTRYPPPTVTIRSDGTTYTFVTFQAGVGLRAGQTWSPAASTPMARLVDVVLKLQKLADGSAGLEFQAELVRAADHLRRQLEAQ